MLFRSGGGAIVNNIGTETWTDNQTNATTSVDLVRAGPILFVQGRMTFTGAGSGANFSITVPAAYTSSAAIAIQNHVGTAYLNDANGGSYPGWIAFLGNNNTLSIVYSDTSAASGILTNLTNTAPFTWASGDEISFIANWQVSGW